MKYYYLTRTKQRVGRSSVWHVTEDYNTKAELKKAKRRTDVSVVSVLTEEQLIEAWKENAKRIMEEARPW